MTDSNDDRSFPFDPNTPDGLAWQEIISRNASANDLLVGPDRRDFERLMGKAFPFDLSSPRFATLGGVMERFVKVAESLPWLDPFQGPGVLSLAALEIETQGLDKILGIDFLQQTEEQKKKSEDRKRLHLEFKENMYRENREFRERRSDPPLMKLKPGRQIDDVRYELLAVVQADIRGGAQMTKAIKKILPLVPGDASDESKIEWFERNLRKLRRPGR